MKRKKFFISAGTGLLGTLFIKPLSIINSKRKSDEKNLKVEINPLAVSRNKIGGKNGE